MGIAYGVDAVIQKYTQTKFSLVDVAGGFVLKMGSSKEVKEALNLDYKGVGTRINERAASAYSSVKNKLWLRSV